LLKPLHHEKSHRQALAERAFLRHIEGGCHAPMGIYCKINGDEFTMRGFFQTETDYLEETVSGVAGEEAAKGRELALMLKERM
jgi:porphobilinogen deaminase